MQPAENKDYSRDVILRLSPTRNTIIVEEQKPGGIAAYFSLANLLVDKDELSSLCESMGIPYTGSTRLSLGDAFRSATGDIRERVPVTVDGETNIYLAYCRDNKRTAGVFFAGTGQRNLES